MNIKLIRKKAENKAARGGHELFISSGCSWAGYSLKNALGSCLKLGQMKVIPRMVINLSGEKQLSFYKHKHWGPCMPRAVVSLLAPCGRACLRWNQLRERRTRRCNKIDPGDTHQASGSTISWSQLCGICTSRSQYMSFIAVLLFSCSVMSNSLRPHGLQHTRFPCPSPSPRPCSNSCPSSPWCHPTMSSSVAPSHPDFNLSQDQGLFQWVRVFASGGQIIGASASTFQWIIQPSNEFNPSNDYSGLISFWIDWFDLLAVQGTLKSLLQHHSSKASILYCLH